MKVVFGGSFNPPTIAHEKIIELLSKRYDEVIIVPNGRKYIRKELFSNKNRVEMLNLIAQKYHNVVVSPLELEREFKGTYYTLRELNHPVFACGDDCLFDFKTWMNAEKLLEENTFLIFTRNNNVEEIRKQICNDKFLSQYQDKFDIISINYPNISSNSYRKTLDQNYLSNDIKAYIDRNKLYKEGCMFAHNYVKVALATPKVILGNPQKNAKEILKIANDYPTASIIVYPELALTGYSLGDWLFNAELLKQAKEALYMIKEHTNNQILILGMPLEYSGAIYNVAVVLQNKKILGIIPKVNLPRTGEFYETRFFTSGKKIVKNPTKFELFGEEVLFGSLLFKNETHNVCFGIEICGDMWGQINPHELLYQKGADIIFNISASTYHFGKKELKKSLIKNASSKFEGAYLYVSNGPSDSSSDITYTGDQIGVVCGEFILDQSTLSLETVVNLVDIDMEMIRFMRYSDGYCRDSLEVEQNFISFTLVQTNDYSLEAIPDLLPFVPKNDNEFNEIIEITSISLKHRLDYVNTSKVIIGISGGLDSTLVLLFAYYTYQKYHLDPKNIIAVTMPGLGTGSKSKNIALNLMQKLGVTMKEVSIKKEAMNQLKLLNHNMLEKDVTYENVQARIRTMYLMNLANLEKGIVLGTGDMSEIALGWSTFNGDHMSMYNLNSGLPKTTIKALVKYFITIYPKVKNELKKVYNAVISPELTGFDQATEDKIGKYQINDFILYHIFMRGASKERIIYLLGICFHLESNDCLKYYENFMRRFNLNQYKRLTSAEGIKIFKLTLNPRGDFRYPGDMK